MPAPKDTVRFSSIIENSVVQGESISMRDYHEDILIMPCYEAALTWYTKYHSNFPPNHQGISKAYQWMLLGFEKEVTAKVIDPDLSPERINVYLNSLQSFFESHQALKDKYYEVNDKLLNISFSVEESILPTVNYYQAAVEGAANVLSIGLEIVNHCREKLISPTDRKVNVNTRNKPKSPPTPEEAQPHLYIPDKMQTRLFKTLSVSTPSDQSSSLASLLETGKTTDRVWVKIRADSLGYVFKQAREAGACAIVADMRETARWLAAYLSYGKKDPRAVSEATVYKVIRGNIKVNKNNQIRLKPS